MTKFLYEHTYIYAATWQKFFQSYGPENNLAGFIENATEAELKNICSNRLYLT